MNGGRLAHDNAQLCRRLLGGAHDNARMCRSLLGGGFGARLTRATPTLHKRSPCHKDAAQEAVVEEELSVLVRTPPCRAAHELVRPCIECPTQRLVPQRCPQRRGATHRPQRRGATRRPHNGRRPQRPRTEARAVMGVIRGVCEQRRFGRQASVRVCSQGKRLGGVCNGRARLRVRRDLAFILARTLARVRACRPGVPQAPRHEAIGEQQLPASPLIVSIRRRLARVCDRLPPHAPRAIALRQAQLAVTPLPSELAPPD